MKPEPESCSHVMLSFAGFTARQRQRCCDVLEQVAVPDPAECGGRCAECGRLCVGIPGEKLVCEDVTRKRQRVQYLDAVDSVGRRLTRRHVRRFHF